MKGASLILIAFLALGVLSYAGLFVYPVNCLILGTNICNFAEVERILRYQGGLTDAERFSKIMDHCGLMWASGKRNKCYYFAATIAEGEDVIEACNHVIDDWGKSTQECIANRGYFNTYFNGE